MRRHRRGRIVIAGTLQKRNEIVGIWKAAAPQPFLKSPPAGQFPFEKVTPRVTFSSKNDPAGNISWKTRRHRRSRIGIAGTQPAWNSNRQISEYLVRPYRIEPILKAAAPQPFLKSHPAGQFPFEKVTPRVTSSSKE